MNLITPDGLSKRHGAATVVDNLFVSSHLLSEMTADDSAGAGQRTGGLE